MDLKVAIKKIKNSLKENLKVNSLLKTHSTQINDLSLEACLYRCKSRTISIQTVIDIGASDGRWSLVTKKYFPKAFYFLVEARKEHEESLVKVKNENNNFDYIISAAGDTIGNIYFDANNLFGGLASHKPFEYDCISISVPVTTIDYQVKDKALKPPFLLKLDTHGFEVPIFEGAKQSLQDTQLIVVETYNFKLTEDSLRFHEMCDYMEKNGFRCIDICEPLHRRKDQAFWQVDLFFVPSSNEVFNSNSFH